MTGFLTVCALGSATLLLSVHLFLPHPEEQQEFDEPSPSSRFLALRHFLALLCAVIFAPLAMIVLQQRKILYRPEVAGRRVSTGHKMNPGAWGLEHRSFFLSSRDGTKLHAWLLYLQRDAKLKKPAVLFFHSNAGDIPQRLDFFSRLCRHLNVVVLAMEYRGFGRSDDAGFTEQSFVEDAFCAYRWLVNFAAEDPGIDSEKLFLFGRSLGGCVAVRLLSHLLGAAAESRSPGEQDGRAAEVALPLPAGLVVENSPSNIADMAVHLMPFLRCARKYMAWPLLLDEWRSDEWLQWIGAVLSQRKRTLPICLLSAVHDKVVPASCMEELRRVGQQHKSLDISFHRFQRGEHMSTYLLAGEQYWQALRSFLH